MKSEKANLPKEIVDAILHNAYLGLSVINKDGVVIFRNKVAEFNSGIKNEKIVGRHFSNIEGKSLAFLEVLKTGIPGFFDTVQSIQGNALTVNRIPLTSENKIVGAMAIGVCGETIFPEEYSLTEKKLQAYENKLKTLQSAKYNLKTIIGTSQAAANVRRLIMKYGQANAPVLITGSTGTGKELCAHAIHLNSARRNCPFIKVNCASIPHDLFESELFGYESGAFTGASKKGKAGKFELANSGTIFLDEISSLPLDMQPKLLRVLQEKEVERVGGNRVKELDVRIISAANMRLESLVRENKFREDLYYRIKIFSLDLPPLDEHKEDIPLLCDYYIKVLNAENGLCIKGVSKEVMDNFLKWHWPGNIREMRNVLESAVYMNETGTLTCNDLPTLSAAAQRG